MPKLITESSMFDMQTEEEKEHLAGYHPHTESTAARAADERRVDLQNEKIDESKLPASVL